MTINERVSPETLDKIIEAADEVITALAGTNEDVHKNDSAKMCQLWDDLNDRYATPAIVKALAAEIKQYRAATEKPVACIDRANLDYFDSGAGADVWPASESDSDDVLLYAAPQLPQPAPVAVPDEMEMDDDFDSAFEHGKAVGWNACRAAMLTAAPAVQAEQLSGNTEQVTKCWCHACRPVTMTDMRFVVCPECGNKRCPHANDHRNPCTGSNEPGQEGSAYPDAPKQEAE